MRWKISHHGFHGHDPRQIDLAAIIALVLVIVAAYRYYEWKPAPKTTASFIESSQTVRW